jgi:hypothetical protein
VLKVLAQIALPVMLLLLAWRVRQTASRFRDAGAIAPEQAKALPDLGLRPGRAIRLLIRRGVLVDVGSERYYFDVSAYERGRRRRRILLLWLLGALALLWLVLTLTAGEV